ncbi:hypothetical protein ACA910_008734 [Epithemia clementina (nom. ined.)]
MQALLSAAAAAAATKRCASCSSWKQQQRALLLQPQRRLLLLRPTFLSTATATVSTLSSSSSFSFSKSSLSQFAVVSVHSRKQEPPQKLIHFSRRGSAAGGCRRTFAASTEVDEDDPAQTHTTPTPAPDLEEDAENSVAAEGNHEEQDDDDGDDVDELLLRRLEPAQIKRYYQQQEQRENIRPYSKIYLDDWKEWMTTKDRLLNKSSKPFRDSDWRDAHDLLCTFVAHRNLHNKSRYLFALLDRLVQEKDALSNLQEEEQPQENEQPQEGEEEDGELFVSEMEDASVKSNTISISFPWNMSVLGFVLKEWRKACVSKGQGEMTQLEFPPLEVVEQVRECVRCGLFPSNDPMPNGIILNAMTSLQKEGNRQCTARHIEQVFRRMEEPRGASAATKATISKTKDDSENEKVDDLPVTPHDGWSYSMVIGAWRREGNPERCEELVREFAQRLQSGELQPSMMDPQTLNLAVAAWSEAILQKHYSQKYKPKHTQGKVAVNPDWVRNGADRATTLLNDWKHLLLPDLITFHTVMNLWKQQSRADRVEELFLELKRLYESNPIKHVLLKPDYDIYRIRLHAWSDLGPRATSHALATRPAKATQVLHEMIDLASPFSSSTTTISEEEKMKAKKQPHKNDFDLVLRSWARSKQPVAGTKAEQVLQEMMRAHAENRFPGSNCCPDAVSFNNVMTAHVRSGAPGSLERVYQLFLELKQQQQRAAEEESAFPVQLDTAVYTTVLQALLRTRDPVALERAEEIFAELKKQQQQQQQQQQHDMSDSIQLDSRVYQVMLQVALMRQRPDRIEEWFQEMKHAFEQEGKTWLEPTQLCYSLRLRAWALAGNPEMTVTALNDWILAASAFQETRAQASLSSPSRRDENVIDNPQAQDFDELLHAWLRCAQNRPDAPVKAEEALRQMWEYSRNQGSTTGAILHCAPSGYSYTNVIATYAKSVTPQSGWHALRLFRELQQLAHYPEQQQGHSTNYANAHRFQPTLTTYAEVIAALCRSPNVFGDDSSSSKVGAAKDRASDSTTTTTASVIASLIDELFNLPNPRLFWGSSAQNGQELAFLLDRMLHDVQSSRYIASATSNKKNKKKGSSNVHSDDQASSSSSSKDEKEVLIDQLVQLRRHVMIGGTRAGSNWEGNQHQQKQQQES